MFIKDASHHNQRGDKIQLISSQHKEVCYFSSYHIQIVRLFNTNYICMSLLRTPSAISISPELDSNCDSFEATCPFQECDEYNKTIFASQREYHTHYSLKHAMKRWKCPGCNKQCSSHTLQRGINGLNANLCGKRSGSNNNLLSHISSVHKLSCIHYKVQ